MMNTDMYDMSGDIFQAAELNGIMANIMLLMAWRVMNDMWPPTNEKL